MISVTEESLRTCTVRKATGTSKDIKLWFNTHMNSFKGASGKIIKEGDNHAKATIEIPK